LVHLVLLAGLAVCKNNEDNREISVRSGHKVKDDEDVVAHKSSSCQVGRFLSDALKARSPRVYLVGTIDNLTVDWAQSVGRDGQL